LLTTKRDRNRVTNRIKSLLFSQGIRVLDVRELPARLGSLRIWNSEPVPERLQERLWREWEKVVQLTAQIQALGKERRKLLESAQDEGSACARQLFRLRGLGENAAWLLRWSSSRPQHRWCHQTFGERADSQRLPVGRHCPSLQGLDNRGLIEGGASGVS
jgi:hypothetical protein